MLDFLYFCAIMLTKTQALVLKSVKFGDNKLIVDLFAEEMGRVAVIVTVSSSQRGRFKRSLFQPLMLLELEIDFRATKNLQSLKSASVLVPYRTLMLEPAKICLTVFLAEFLYMVTRGEQKNQRLYRYIRSSIEWLDAKDGNISNFHIVFMMRLAKFIGFSPNVDDYSEGCCFDLRSGGFSARLPLHKDVVAADDAKKILTLLRMNYDNMHLFVMSRDERNRLLDILLNYYSIHVPDFQNMRTLDILHSLYE